MKPTFSERLKENLSKKYRLLIINNETFEEEAAISAVKGRLIFGAVAVFLLITALNFALIRFTPLRNLAVPSNELSDSKAKEALIAKVQEMEEKFRQQETLLASMQKASGLEEDVEASAGAATVKTEPKPQPVAPQPVEPQPQTQAVVEAQPAPARPPVQLTQYPGGGTDVNKWMRFVQPVEGRTIRKYEPEKGHFALDIAAEEKAPVYAAAEGIVIFSEYSVETGYVIAIQHPNNFVSFYKHNRALFKKGGQYVQAGEVVALVGDSGENSNGPHLHFELWQKGRPVNPTEYLAEYFATKEQANAQ